MCDALTVALFASPYLRDALGEQFNSIDRVAEDNGLVHLELRKQGMQAVDLLTLLDKGVELRHALERELVHQVDLVWFGHVAVTE